MKPELTIGQILRRGMWRDSLKSLVILLIATNVISAYHYAWSTLSDPHYYLAYNGSFGPMAYRDGMAAAIPDISAFGPPQTVFHAGDRVAFTTDMCRNKGVAITGHAELVRTAQNGVAQTVIDRRDTPVPATSHRCGPRLGNFRFDVDALPGSYEIRRWATVDDDGTWLRKWWPVRKDFETLVVQVVTTVYTAPLAPSSPDEPTSTH